MDIKYSGDYDKNVSSSYRVNFWHIVIDENNCVYCVSISYRVNFWLWSAMNPVLFLLCINGNKRESEIYSIRDWYPIDPDEDINAKMSEIYSIRDWYVKKNPKKGDIDQVRNLLYKRLIRVSPIGTSSLSHRQKFTL